MDTAIGHLLGNRYAFRVRKGVGQKFSVPTHGVLFNHFPEVRIMGEEKDLLQEVTALAPEKRLSCPLALALANRLGIAPIEVGRAANRLGIKIIGCQLGCFGAGKDKDR
ncbi:MAG: hypothetical protein ACOYEK_03330 [bacterium]